MVGWLVWLVRLVRSEPVSNSITSDDLSVGCLLTHSVLEELMMSYVR